MLRDYRQAGGADRDRTGDPLLAKQVLSQLSYSPEITIIYIPKNLEFVRDLTLLVYR